MKRFKTTAIAFSLIAIVASQGSARSLWSDNAPSNSLFTGANAQRVGDIVSIIVQENNQANDTADGEAARTQNVNGLFSMIFNNRFMSKVFGGANEAPQLSLQTTNDFQGETEVDRSNSFNSQVAARIVKIDPVGNYLIEARKTIRIGEEQKTIVLSGVIRPQDISVDNTVQSSQVADAEISYLGDGTLTKFSNPTIFQKIFGFLF